MIIYIVVTKRVERVRLTLCVCALFHRHCAAERDSLSIRTIDKRIARATLLLFYGQNFP